MSKHKPDATKEQIICNLKAALTEHVTPGGVRAKRNDAILAAIAYLKTL